MELADRAHRTYARWLRWGSWVGVAILVSSFVGYLAGMVPHFPIERLPEIWERPAADYVAATGLQTGWHWATLLHRSDMMVLGGIALLASCSIVGLVAGIVAFRRGGEHTLAVICALQVVVLVAAASGLLTVSH